MQVSTFGQVLQWVHDRLSQVEESMHTNPQSDLISNACNALDNLIKEDACLKDEYAKAAETEYAALVTLIQNRNIPITDELEELAVKIRQNQ